MTRAEKWKLLEDIFLFEETDSRKEYEHIQKKLHWYGLLRNEEAKKEQAEWKATEVDFFLDHNKILEALNTSQTYQVVSTEKEEESIVETLSNGMKIEYDTKEIRIYFPKEKSNFCWLTSFLLEENHSVVFQGRESGGAITPLDLEILFSDNKYQITYYNTPLSERAWEKIFFISIDYYNAFLERNHLTLKKIPTTFP